VEADIDGAIRQNFDEFDISTVGLDGGADEVDDFLDPGVKIGPIG
jgi:hypothetical protein